MKKVLVFSIFVCLALTACSGYKSSSDPYSMFPKRSSDVTEDGKQFLSNVISAMGSNSSFGAASLSTSNALSSEGFDYQSYDMERLSGSVLPQSTVSGKLGMSKISIKDMITSSGTTGAVSGCHNISDFNAFLSGSGVEMEGEYCIDGDTVTLDLSKLTFNDVRVSQFGMILSGSLAAKGTVTSGSDGTVNIVYDTYRTLDTGIKATSGGACEGSFECGYVRLLMRGKAVANQYGINGIYRGSALISDLNGNNEQYCNDVQIDFSYNYLNGDTSKEIHCLDIAESEEVEGTDD